MTREQVDPGPKKEPTPRRLCARCLKEFEPGEARMRLPDFRTMHLECYERRDEPAPRAGPGVSSTKS